jgi:hypothetical protein
MIINRYGYLTVFAVGGNKIRHFFHFRLDLNLKKVYYEEVDFMEYHFSNAGVV